MSSPDGGLRAASSSEIAPLDPLAADGTMAALPDWNEAGDLGALTAALRALAPTPARARGLGVFEACAAMRDIGMLLSSLKRHGVEPAEAVPEISPVLLALGKTCAMVPRDTVYHYGSWNPTGARQRRFTRDANEDGLIHCVRAAAPGVEAAIAALVEAGAIAPNTLDFTERCRHAARCVMSMVDSINFARRRVDVRFFAQVLRPYFEAIVVDGQSYMGPAAAHLPLSVVDHLTWGSDCRDPFYRTFQEDAAKYTVPVWRDVCHDTEHRPSLVTRVVEALDAATTAGTSLFEASAAVYAILRVLLAFRGRHKVLADKAYDPRVRVYPVGSGGYSVEAVAHILDVTRERAVELKDAVKRRRGTSLKPPSDIADLLTGRA